MAESRSSVGFHYCRIDISISNPADKKTQVGSVSKVELSQWLSWTFDIEEER